MAFLIVHPEIGIYLGSAMGLGFWSRLDPCGQDAAVVFPSEAEAREAAASWQQPMNNLLFLPIEPDESVPGGATYASIAACQAAGLPGWDPDREEPDCGAAPLGPLCSEVHNGCYFREGVCLFCGGLVEGAWS